ncbi:MAG: tetratricopeptide repeat protein [Myxococcaceae bacterium]
MLTRMAQLYAGPLDSPEQAFITAARALRELPDDGTALEMCLSYAQAAEAEDALIEVLEEVAPRANAPESRTALYRALAQMKEREGELDEAVDAWRRVLETTPQDHEALETMTRLLASQDRGEELLDILRRQLSMAEDPERRADVLFQMGALQADVLRDPASALTTFRRLIELRPDDATALERMDALCQQQERWPELADTLVRRLSLLAGEGEGPGGEGRAIELKFRLGQIRESRLMDRVGALDLYREILTSVPTHAGALTRVEAMVEREPQNREPADVLLRAYRQSRNLSKLTDLLSARAGITEDGFERKPFLLELAQIRLDQLDEPELAFMSLMRAFREDPNDAEVRQRIERAADAAKTWDELAGVYEEDLPRIAEATDAAEVCLKLGQLFDQRLGESERAVTFYEKARQLDLDTQGRVLPALDRLYNQLARPEELIGVLGALAERASESAEKIGFLFRLGQIAQEALDSPDRAAEAYERILELDPQHLASARLLEQLYEGLGHADHLYRVLEHQRDRVTGAERERVLGRMAQVSAESLSDVGRSIEIYRDLLAKNPRNDQAFSALEVLLEKAGRAEELRALLETRLGHTIDPREIVRLNARLGWVIWKLAGNAEEAVPYFKAALERDARHRGALEALRDIYEATERTDDLVIVLRRLVPLQEDAQGVKRVRLRLAEILASMQRREEALDAGRRALEVEPHEAADLDRVHRLFFGLRAWGDAVRALELRADVELSLDRPDKATATLFEVADLWTGAAQKPESAGAPLERVLEIDPAHRAAYERARELYERHHDWRAYAQITDRFLPHLVTEEEKVETLRELAQVQEHKLGHKDVAFLAECRALQLSPADATIREAVERLADETGSYEELAAVYEELADDLPKGPLAERLYMTLAQVHDEKLDDPAAAEAALRNILEFDPTNAHALEQLAGMFARRGRNKEYVVALEQQLEATGSIEQRKQILREIARVFDEVVGDPQESANALLRALELEADADTLGVLAQLFRRQKAWNQVAETLLRWRDLAPTPEERARLQTEVAQVYERELNDDEAAIAGYRQALEFDPGNREALGSLERLYTKLDRPSDLLSVYERQMEVTQDYRERTKILFKSAAIWEDRYHNLANADACIEGVLSMDPQNLLAIKTLERLRRSQERWEELVGVLQHHINLVGAAVDQAELLVELGDVLHQHMRQVDRAVAMYHRALELNPQSRPAMHALGTLYERSGNWPFALDMLAREAQVAGNTPAAVELYHRMGKINEDMLLDPASARSCYESALRIDPGYLPCIRAHKGIHQIEKDWDAYERVLVQEARGTEEPEAKAKALIEVAQFLSEKKEDRDGAAEYYEEALKYVPDLLEAARPLADLYVAREDWPGAERMLDIVAVQMASRAVADQDEGLARELCRQLYRLGYVTEKLGKKEKALGAYEKAYQLDATYLPALEGLGNLLVQHGRFEESLKVYQTILIHHRDDLTDLEVVEIYWQLGDVHLQLGQADRAENHFEKALAIDPGHEPSLRALVQIADAAGNWEKAAEYRQSLLKVLEEEPRFGMAVELAKLARDKLSDPYMAIDAFLAAHRLRPSVLDVMDGLYVLYRETRQGQKAAEVLEKMLAEPELRASSKLKRVWYALGEICRDELKDVDRAAMAFNAALDADHRFLEAFSALEQILASQKQWKLLEDNYARMIQRLPKTPETHTARMTLWRALGDLYRQVQKNDDAAFLAYQAAATGLPDDAQVQETFAELAQRRPGEEQKAVDAWRRALPTTTDPARVVNALATLQATRKEYDRAWIAAQVAHGLIGQVGDAEREILTKLTPYAKKREQATQPLTDRLWKAHMFHPKVRTPLAELMAILFEQVGHHYASPHAQYQINPRKHRIDVASSQVLQIHQYRYVAKLLGMDALELYSPYLVATLERMQRKSNDPAPEPLVGIEICHTHPVCLKVGGKFFPRDHSEAAQKELAYQLGRTMALLRPELAFSQRLPAERLEALLQAAVSLSVQRFRFTADPRAIEQERKLLEKALTQQARMALTREVGAYVQTATPEDLRNYLEGAELTAVRTGLFVAGEVEPVKRAVMGETGNAYRVPARSKIRDLVVFALSDDLHALRVAVGTSVEVSVRR